MIRKGVFGWEGYFEQLIESLTGSADYYLLANDFPSYLEAQVRGAAMSGGDLSVDVNLGNPYCNKLHFPSLKSNLRAVWRCTPVCCRG